MQKVSGLFLSAEIAIHELFPEHLAVKLKFKNLHSSM